MTKSLIKNKINAVFVPVSDLTKAKEWYAKILGMKEGEVFFEHLFAAEMDEGSSIILDTMPLWKTENGKLPTYNFPAIQFGTDDIHASYQYMKENGVELVTEIQQGHFFVFKDLDGNMLMVCED